MTNKQLHNLKKKWLMEGYKMALKEEWGNEDVYASTKKIPYTEDELRDMYRKISQQVRKLLADYDSYVEENEDKVDTPEYTKYLENIDKKIHELTLKANEISEMRERLEYGAFYDHIKKQQKKRYKM